MYGNPSSRLKMHKKAKYPLRRKFLDGPLCVLQKLGGATWQMWWKRKHVLVSGVIII